MKKITTPSALRKYALALAAVLYTEGYVTESSLLEEAARLPCTTGGEWLSELGAACIRINKNTKLTILLKQQIDDLLTLVTSKKPYSE